MPTSSYIAAARRLPTCAPSLLLRSSAYSGGSAPDSTRFDTPIGSYLQWETGPSGGPGVELWLQVNSVNQIIGCNPHYVGQGRLDAAIIETVSAPGRPLDGHCFGWAAPRDPGN